MIGNRFPSRTSPAADADDAGLHASHQLALLQQLREAATDKVRQGAQIEASWQTRVTRAESDFRQGNERVERELRGTLQATRQEFEGKLAAARDAFDQGSQELARRQRRDLDQLRQNRADALAAAAKNLEQRLARIQEMSDGLRRQLDVERESLQQRLEEVIGQGDKVLDDVRALIARRGGATELADPSRTVAQAAATVSWEQLAKELQTVGDRLAACARLPAARFLDEGWPVLCGLAAALIAIYPSGALWGWTSIVWPATAIGAGIAAGLVARALGRKMARQELGQVMPQFRADLSRVRQQLQGARLQADVWLQEKKEQQKVKRVEEQRRAEKVYADALAEIEHQYAEREEQLRGAMVDHSAELNATWTAETQHAQQHYPARIEQLEQQIERELATLSADRQQQLADADQRRDRDLERIETQWRKVLEEFAGHVAAMNAYRARHFSDWSERNTATWQPPPQPLTAIPFGTYQVRLAQLVPASMRRDDELPGEFSLPAVLTAPDRPSLLLETADQGRDEAVQVMHDVMLRWLTAAPAGKVRFTIIDPVGLGQNFSMFMHLADYDERLVNNRIWTDPEHIRRRLADLTEHMEHVIQKYLRNEYRSIQEYNQVAGEVAEPIHVLVVANFPEGFGDEAARRLASIAASGPRCGVYLLASIDARLPLPRDFYLNELEEHAATLVWGGGGFVWKHAELARWPLQMAPPPTPEQSVAIIHTAGQLAQGAQRVEVPFHTVVPADDDWWSHDSRSELLVPLGRVGATKLQKLRLGHGTSQHVLVAGKTGSGKSTLFHALITNLALHYSPTEVELYLIDFKKGVEFKAYAEHQLPHARVIAIESEREFGLSVLERLDEELKIRGDLFRRAGTQDVKGYREALPDAVLPRIVLIIDEFQEFFVKEDRIARDAALLLDRLVRQGRAFGVHVLLGSQTLAGAYTLARSTLGQMAVRIALQCSETDAHLILSEDNTAARLLSRPGEAIYNDANGMLEGNHLFQVVWLSDRERVDYLNRIETRARQRQLDLPPAVVFEGNEPADLASNAELRRVLQAPTQPRPLGAWLGAAVAIRPPTFVDFERQSGANQLIVGQDQELTQGLLTASAIGFLATARSQSSQPQFHILRPSGGAGVPREWWETLNGDAGGRVHIAGPAAAAKRLAAVVAELQSRLDEPEAVQAPWLVVIDNLARFRELRRDEDLDFGSFSDGGKDKSLSPSKALARLLRDGPAVGIHTVVACDSYTTFSRWLERSALRDFASRILLQMSPTDSSHFMDSPAANQLGACRAILYREEKGEAETFRPYRPAPLDWRSHIGP